MTDERKTYTLITGASGGFGAEFARLCAADGRNLVLIARSGDKLRGLADELKGDITIHVIAQDLSEVGAAQKVYKKLRQLRVDIDQLINNAGSGDFAPLARAVAARQEKMINVNITSLTILTNLLLPGMIKRGRGRILNVGSVASFIPLPNMSVYAASKAFVRSFSQALSAELHGSGVTVTCLCPGPAKTGFARSARLSSTHPISRSRTSAASVASYGYRAMLAGAPVAIPGLRTRFLIACARFFPRATARNVARAYNTS